MLTVGSLFTGIGGLDLGLERAGMTVRWQSEIDPYASRVLAKHWPHVPNLGDITAIDWSTVGAVDLVCGGYPCQPFSFAGARRGGDDPRHLWPHMLRAVRHLRPRYALLENVPGHLSLGFGRVLGDLAEIGYDVEWCSVPAAAVGAPHLRWRLFAVATDTGRDELRHQPVAIFGRSSATVARDDGSARDVADADSGRLDERGERDRQPATGLEPSQRHDTGGRGEDVQRRPEQDWWAEPVDLSAWWAVEPDVGRVAHGVPHRVDRLRCLGNAVVPAVAQWVGEQIMNHALTASHATP